MQMWRKALEYLNGLNIGLDAVVQQQANYKKSCFKVVWVVWLFLFCGLLFFVLEGRVSVCRLGEYRLECLMCWWVDV